MTQIQKHIGLLGHQAKDRVTGFSGVVECVSFDLYGCVQATLRPKMDDKGNVPDARWFDASRLVVTSQKPVMDAPDFDRGHIAEGKKGAAEKPAMA